MIQLSTFVSEAEYPHIDLSERSARRGNEGNPRYVPWQDGLGDTNTGLFVFPHKKCEVTRGSLLDDLQEEIRERLVIVNGD